MSTSLLPIMSLSYLFQFLDKSALGYTAIMGLTTDLSMTGSQYSWSSGIYYFGYLVASYPVAWLLVRLPVGKTIAISVYVNPATGYTLLPLTHYSLIWGAILMLTSTCFNAQGLLAIRFFLGVAEAAIGPGLTVIVAMWYKRSEQPLRHGAWFMGNVIAGIFGGLLAYGVGHVQSIAPWKVSILFTVLSNESLIVSKAVFLVFGALTVTWSFFIYFFLPDTPANARFLSKEDRGKAIDRVRENMTGIRSDTWKWSQSVEALTDIKIWLLVAIQLSQNIANGGVHGVSLCHLLQDTSTDVSQFGSIVIEGFGFSTLNTLLVQMISVAFQAVFVIVGTVGSTYLKNARTYFMAFNLAVSLVGSVMVRQLDPTSIWPRFFGYCLCIAYSANFPLVLSMSSSNIGGFTKKNTVNAMVSPNEA